MIKVIRALNWNESRPTDACFSPADVDLEIEVFQIAHEILTERLNGFPTTLEQDLEMIPNPLNIRHFFAVIEI